ncbi:hypothetical protein PT974_03651 [Cladobotryum mycophilum]|uniref:N-acetyltransferase domain-containing protein n=1 Tax=Cladobotryum mycophilum TaxID=491253 RepID=A0ABR0STJ3_9HYPO
MNRFLTKKKGKEDISGPRPSIDSESSGPFRMFGKNKKIPDEEPKAEVDLTNVLPSSDDFRTSLIMTGLSARFSMLREQDDPNTKVGKASDDSVLFPKRHSKLMQFALDGGLRDITEVESLRSNGYDALSAEEMAAGGSSIMNRSKPTEGNNLFGGRQKIYRIPANGPDVGRDGGMPGRALYDDDVALSGFQKWRLAEKERQLEEDGVNSTSESDSQPTSSRRQTSSTTSSAPSATARNSTADTSAVLAHRAPSVKDPQPNTQNTSGLERSVTRTRRLYEKGLNRELVDQQSSALSRMNSLSTRAFGTLTPDIQSPISGSFGDRRQILSKASAPNLRSFTPSATSSPRSIAEVSSSLERSDSRSGFGANPPLTPPISEAEGQSSAQRKESDSTSVKAQRNIPVDIQTTSFFDDSDSHSMLNQSIGPLTPQLALERPDDDDHPAFRKSALPTPLMLASKMSGSMTPRPEDSPTLGPNTGLSGMVRAHLRSESNASSIYDTNQDAQNGQNASGREVSPAPASISSKQTLSRSPSRIGSEEDEKEKDAFARHLADGARRVREKLTTYVDADPDRATPLPSSPVETPKELNPPRPTLGLLRSKSSRGSLFDRESRDQSRTLKTAISSSNISVLTPSPRKISGETDDFRGRSTQVRDQVVDEADEQDDNVHVGLKAFRQARRELQKVKEMETQQRHQPGTPRPQALRAMSYDTSGPSPYNRMPLEESRNGLGSRSGSRAPSERDRSGSDTSNGGVPSRMRNGSLPEDHVPASPSSTRRMPYMTNGVDYRPRNGSNGGMLPATASTPNLHAPVGAPPLPPINPRRKGGLGRSGEDDSPLASPRMPGGFPGGDDGSDDEMSMEERRQKLRRATSEGNSLHGRARNSPPRNNARPPLPQGTIPNGRAPGVPRHSPPSLSPSEPANRLAPYIWTHQYTLLSPATCFVLDDGAGRAVGYCIGCPDIPAFVAAYGTYVASVLEPSSPHIIRRPDDLDSKQPLFLEGGEVNETALAQWAYNPDLLLLRGNDDLMQEGYTATMHIDLLDEWQGKGWGKKLINSFLQSVQDELAKRDGGGVEKTKTKGIWIGVAGDNSKVVPFYEKQGFVLKDRGRDTSSICMTKDF